MCLFFYVSSVCQSVRWAARGAALGTAGTGSGGRLTSAPSRSRAGRPLICEPCRLSCASRPSCTLEGAPAGRSCRPREAPWRPLGPSRPPPASRGRREWPCEPRRKPRVSEPFEKSLVGRGASFEGKESEGSELTFGTRPGPRPFRRRFSRMGPAAPCFLFARFSSLLLCRRLSLFLSVCALRKWSVSEGVIPKRPGKCEEIKSSDEEGDDDIPLPSSSSVQKFMSW